MRAQRAFVALEGLHASEASICCMGAPACERSELVLHRRIHLRAKRASVARAKRRLRLRVCTVPTDVLQNLTRGEAEHLQYFPLRQAVLILEIKMSYLSVFEKGFFRSF